MGTPGTSSKGSQNIAEWLPLLGSIVLALRGMADDDPAGDDPAAERTPAAARGGESSPGTTGR